MLRTYLVYNTVVRLCQFFCFGGKANFCKYFLVESENFLLVHKNRYSEGMDNGQNIPHGHPDFHSYVKLYVFHIPDIFLVNTLLLYSLSPYGQTESLTEKKIHSLHVGWRNFFPVVLLCQVFDLAGNR